MIKCFNWKFWLILSLSLVARCHPVYAIPLNKPCITKGLNMNANDIANKLQLMAHGDETLLNAAIFLRSQQAEINVLKTKKHMTDMEINKLWNKNYIDICSLQNIEFAKIVIKEINQR
jgi:phosphoribosylamine-glycine ligase